MGALLLAGGPLRPGRVEADGELVQRAQLVGLVELQRAVQHGRDRRHVAHQLQVVLALRDGGAPRGERPVGDRDVVLLQLSQRLRPRLLPAAQLGLGDSPGKLEAVEPVHARPQVQPRGALVQGLGAVRVGHLVGVLLHEGVPVLGEPAGHRQTQAKMVGELVGQRLHRLQGKGDGVAHQLRVVVPRERAALPGRGQRLGDRAQRVRPGRASEREHGQRCELVGPLCRAQDFRE